MADTFSVSIDVAAPLDEVWAVVGDPCGVTRWYSLYTGCGIEGDIRTLERADGAVIVERLIDRDDARRTYSYSVVSGLPLREHYARFTVAKAPGGSRVIWGTRAVHQDDGVDMEARLADRQREALRGLKRLIEDR